MELSKSEGASDNDRLIQGMASCEARDLQNETVFQRGMNVEPLLKSGFINLDHGGSVEDIIGVPLKFEITEISQHPVLAKSGMKGLGSYILGRLFAGQPKADAVWNLVKALREYNTNYGMKDGNTRGLAWSIQGAVVARENDKLTDTIVKHIALTHQPVQQNSFAEMVKSLSIGSAPAMMLEQIDAGKPKINIYGDCKENHFNKSDGYFSGGVKGFLEHMIYCQGQDFTTSKNIAADIISNPKYFRRVYNNV